METKKVNNQRAITGDRVLVYTRFASKSVFYNLVTPKERKQYFEAVKVLRNLADEYCETCGIDDIDSIKPKLIFK